MPVAGSNVWAFSVRVVDGYLVPGARGYFPGSKVLTPHEAVEKLREDPSQTLRVQLLGMNYKTIQELWDSGYGKDSPLGEAGSLSLS